MFPKPAFPAATAAALLMLGLTACSATALPLRPATLADVAVIDRTSGERLPIYGHAGARWVAGTPGHRYAIEVRNRTGARLLAVMSVDGVNVISGETAGWDQRGYVFAPYERYGVAGWRKSQQQIAAFEFAALPDSYAARTARPDNVGVIGIALFRETPPPPAVTPAPSVVPLTPPLPRSALPAPAPADSAAPAASARAGSEGSAVAKAAPGSASPLAEAPSRLGTAHGDAEASYVATTEFERAQPSPDEVVTIRYDRRENLVAMGVLPPPSLADHSPIPVPFPLSDSGYVPDPPAR
jgi:hypothetical protein